MLIDGRTLPDGRSLEADVAIAGAGPAGITLARELAASGIRVALIESGGHEADRAVQALAEGESVGLPYYKLGHARSRQFGGTSERWLYHGGWRVRPLDPEDFEDRPWLKVPGWPFRRSELEPYHLRAQASIGIEPKTNEHWGETGDAPPLAQQDGPFESKVFRFAAPDCFHQMFAPLSADEHVQLVTHATLVGLQHASGGDSIRSFTFVTAAGSRLVVRARSFVLALGGIENARMLLALSGETGHPLGNEHDQVGRNFMEHPSFPVAVLRPRSQAASEPLAAYRVSHPNPPPGEDRMISIAAARRRDEGLFAAGFRLLPIDELRSTAGVRAFREIRRRRRIDPPMLPDRRDLGAVLRESPRVINYVTQRLLGREPAPNVFELRVIGEQTPHPDSRVTLGLKRDHSGLPVARLNWRVSNDDIHSLVRSSEAVVAAFERLAGTVSTTRYPFQERVSSSLEGLYHHLGTTRMSEDPRFGVVDPHGRVHDTENLYVAGGSVFPTGGLSNPTLTIVALSMKLADHLALSISGTSAGVASATIARNPR